MLRRHEQCPGVGLAHCAMLFAPAEDTFDHLAALLRLVITPMPRRAAIDRASSPLAGFGRALVLRHMRRDADGTQVFDMVFRVVGLVRAGRNAMNQRLCVWLSAWLARALSTPSHCQIEHVTNLLARRTHAAATTSRHVCMADALKARCVLAEVRWRWTLKVL